MNILLYKLENSLNKNTHYVVTSSYESLLDLIEEYRSSLPQGTSIYSSQLEFSTDTNTTNALAIGLKSLKRDQDIIDALSD